MTERASTHDLLFVRAVPPQRVATQARKAPRKQKSLAEDFPLGTTGLYLTLLAFIAFVSAALYWVVILSYPTN